MNSIVDAHHHLWDLELTPQPWLDDSMGPINRSFGHADLVRAVGDRVDATILVQTASDDGETQLMLDIAATSDLVAGVVGWTDLTASDVADRIAHVLSSPHGAFLSGIRHQVHDEPDPTWLDRADVRR